MIFEEKSVQPAHRLVSWYREHMRPLPWRSTKDPYAIWVSETMLQQTRVETVIPYYHRFLSAFPTIEALANADEEQVLKLWQGLGYYSRIRNLHKAAKAVVAEFGGAVPATFQDFSQLPGVGPYTAGAVLSIAFSQPIPAVDGNVLRVMARYLGIRDPIDKPHVKKAIYDVVAKWHTETEPRDLTQALMELGAMVCVPRSPRCQECPIAENCFARNDGTADQLPVRQKKAPRKVMDVYALWFEVDAGVLVEKRPEQGLLASMWQLPAVEVPRTGATPNGEVGHAALSALLETLCRGSGGTGQRTMEQHAWVEMAHEKHIFTHVEWYVHVLRPVGVHLPQTPAFVHENQALTPRAELERLVLPRVYEKLLDAILGKSGTPLLPLRFGTE